MRPGIALLLAVMEAAADELDTFHELSPQTRTIVALEIATRLRNTIAYALQQEDPST